LTLRSRLTLVAAGAVAAVLVAAGIVVYITVAASTRGQIDDALRRQAAAVASGATAPTGGGGQPSDGQVVDADGRVTPIRPDSLTLPFQARARAVAAGRASPFFADVRLAGSHLRVYVSPIGSGRAVELAQPLDRVDDLLQRLRSVLVFVTTIGVVAAFGAGWAVARSALLPVRRLQRAARELALAEGGDRFLPVEGGGELADLAASFNEMLVALRRSLVAQRQLVADASHELRTPLTSLRTNVEFLLRDPSMADHAPVLRDLQQELEDLSRLVDDLLELARLEAGTEEPSELRLDELVADVVNRAERRWPNVPIRAQLSPTVVLGLPGQLERAVTNLIDNAATWTAAGEGIDVEVAGGEVVVRDHGPGIATEDLPRVFERFYRSPEARERPGSGLGLAIVRQVALTSGGSVTAERPADGGTRMRLRLPPADTGP
jgi:two-component system sensor histidine kinase MprB